MAGAISILCVDDNEEVARALEVQLRRAGGFEWKGWLADADALLEFVVESVPDIVLLDLDMPGKNPFDVLTELSEMGLATRAVVFSGHIGKGIVDQALDAGAWGYISKSDAEQALVDSIRRVMRDEMVLSPEVREVVDRS